MSAPDWLGLPPGAMPDALLVVDISAWQRQDELNWYELAAHASAVMIRATEGKHDTDVMFHAHRQSAHEHGLPLGTTHNAYPRLHSKLDGARAEAANYCHAITDGGGAVTALDIEPQNVLPGGSPGDQWAWLDAWRGQVRRMLGAALDPWLYLNEDIWRRVLGGSFGGREPWPLWFACYYGPLWPPPIWPAGMPAPVLWQASGSAHVVGTAKPIDLDWLLGGEAALAEFFGAAV